jgi:DNA-binding response OmpR family regulator
MRLDGALVTNQKLLFMTQPTRSVWRKAHRTSVLLVEDHTLVAKSIVQHLEQECYDVDYAADGVAGLRLGQMGHYDVIVLDIGLPRMGGLEVCQHLRARRRLRSSILMLSASDALQDKLAGFAAGADDYLVKPFSHRELAARIMVLSRMRRNRACDEILTVGDLTLDIRTFSAFRDGQKLTLTPFAMRLLNILMRESPAVVPRSIIEWEMWGAAPPGSDSLRSHIYRLRSIIDGPFQRPLLHTVTSQGFRMADIASDPLLPLPE